MGEKAKFNYPQMNTDKHGHYCLLANIHLRSSVDLFYAHLG